MAIIAPSLLAADFLNLGAACTMLNNSEAEWFHLDVMDGRFVPNISYGPGIVKSICSTTSKFCDAHLMIVEPEKYVPQFAEAGVQQISVHYEACPHLHRNIEQIKKLGVKAGVALNPHTACEVLYPVLDMIDTVLLMSVNPGFGGQSFISSVLQKVSVLAAERKKLGLHFLIEIDGGVGLDNAAALVAAGADVLVAGSSVFNASDPVQAIAQLKGL